MSGIAGIFNFDGAPVGAEPLAAMLRVMAARGPDGRGQHVAGAIGFGHCLLATTPESLGEQQPIRDESSGYWLTADARIDNREELLGEFARARIPVRTGSDAELLLCAYLRWGEMLLDHLVGDFAFALWDVHRQRLFCARDPLGVKPFYYFRDNARFVFASELKAVLACPGVPRQVNELMIGLFLADDFSRKDLTLYQDVFRLPGAHQLVVEARALRVQRYWQPRLDQPIHYARDTEYIEQFREIFTRAVECRLRSTGPVGALLSGGLDSGSVVSMAQHLYQQRAAGETVEAFSGHFQEPLCDEREYIQELLCRWPVHHHPVALDSVGATTYAEQMAREFENIHEPTLYFFWALAEKARENGVRVILTGTGGDEFCTGSPYIFADLLRRGRIFHLAREINQATTALFLLSRRAMWVNYTLKPLVPLPARKLLRRLRWKLRGRFPPWIVPEFASRIRLAEHLATDQKTLPKTGQATRHVLQTLENGYWSFVVESINATAAANQVEFRFPFADSRLVDFALRIPQELFLRRGFPKWLLRAAMEGVLPEHIRLRKRKTTFDAVVEKELRERPLLPREGFDSLELARDGYVVAGELRSLYNRVCAGGTWQGIALYSILSLELWYKLQGKRNIGSLSEANERPGGVHG